MDDLKRHLCFCGGKKSQGNVLHSSIVGKISNKRVTFSSINSPKMYFSQWAFEEVIKILKYTALLYKMWGAKAWGEK